MISSGTETLLSIQADQLAATELIGAKARSLQQMTAFGFRVPSGVILTTVLFQPWFDILRRSPSWDAWRSGKRESWPALNLPCSDVQQLTFAALSERLAEHGPARRFAVRSSFVARSGGGFNPRAANNLRTVASLENPHDKAINPGEIPAAFTTDPGWTPLFINAPATDVLTRFRDGQPVEADGGAGVVRFKTQECPSAVRPSGLAANALSMFIFDARLYD